MLRRTLLALAACAAALPALAAEGTVEVAGVKYEPAVTLGGGKLALNGAGIRYKFAFKVYTAGLYLAKKAATPEEAIAMPGAKRLHIVMLRDIDGNELGKLFVKGMQDNASREDFAKSINGTIRMGEVFAAKKRMAAGENFGVDYIPGTGTVINVNGVRSGEPIKEPEFYASMLKIWLGNHPADDQLKDALLGHTRPARGAREP